MIFWIISKGSDCLSSLANIQYHINEATDVTIKTEIVAKILLMMKLLMLNYKTFSTSHYFIFFGLPSHNIGHNNIPIIINQ